MTSVDETPTPLEGTPWTAEAYDDGRGVLVEVLPGTQITARFDDGHVAGSGGCNRYTASWLMVGTTLEIGAIASTRMACLEPTGVMAQEAAYLAALSRARLYRVEGNRLSLASLDGTPVVVFVGADSSAAE
jgi:heat shock protein HslJ